MEYMESKMQDQIEGAQHSYEVMSAELDRRKRLLAWAYRKLHMRTFDKMDDALKMDEIKLLLEHDI